LVSLRYNYLEEAKKLLRLMGLPVISAPGEAEAQCAAIAASGMVILAFLW
jgi:flap endonuclease-1